MTERCPFCGQVSEVVWVRAHYQCASCGQVVIPCCNGETACDFPGASRPLTRSNTSQSEGEGVAREET
jgi:hypothetical protein